MFEKIEEGTYQKVYFAERLLDKIGFYKRIAPMNIINSKKDYINTLEQKCIEVSKK